MRIQYLFLAGMPDCHPATLSPSRPDQESLSTIARGEWHTETSLPGWMAQIGHFLRRRKVTLRALGIKKARVVGHDIGLMVAYAYAAQFPDAVDKLVVMDAFLPGVAGWETVYNNPAIWHFRFFGPTPEALVHGRERIYFEHYWNDFAADPQHSIPEADRKAYTAAYSRPGRMRAGWLYFASWPGTANAIGQLSQHPLTMPVLSIGGEKANGAFLAQQMKIVASNVTVVILKDAGHWLMEERSKETTDALMQFL